MFRSTPATNRSHGWMAAVPALLLAAVFALGACAADGSYAERLEGWSGAPESSLVAAWGKPDRRAPLADGGASLVYTYQRVLLMPAYALPDEHSLLAQTMGASTTLPFVVWCETRFRIGPDGKVAGHAFTGNACPAH